MRYKDADLSNCDEKIKEAIKKAIEERKGLFIYGDTGTGKTYTIHSLAKKTKSYVNNFVTLLSEFRDYMQKGYYYQSITDFTDKEYIYIDDIGSEKTSDFVQEFIYIIVNKRYENMKRTVFSTNLSLSDFRQRYGDRILSRISEMCILVELKGQDKRLQ